MKNVLLVFLLLIALGTNAQYNIRLVVTDVATRRNDDIYVAGNFNNWNPQDEKYKLKVSGPNIKAVVIKDVPAGNYAFKFTRGSFDKVECAPDGKDIEDRVMDVQADVSVELKIEGWKDDYPQRPKRYTASPNVKIMDTAFQIPQLNRKRRIWVYLPKSYAVSSKTYPVMYMHDGQNLFNDQTAAFGEWGVDECLDSMQLKTGKETIIVGIDNGGDKRMTEYNPYDNTQFGKEEGKEYIEFIVKNLKPYIDSKYRTKKSAPYTFIAGSSMGGLISLYAIIQYPEVFGGAGIYSPSLWIAPQLYDAAIKFNPLTVQPAFYFYAGGSESATMVGDMKKMYDILQQKKSCKLVEVINPLGQHSEKYWRLDFPNFYNWLMSVTPN
jgi:metallo-beta-lactamase class B